MPDYVDKTIEAYDNAPSKFVSATSGMTSLAEMEIMLKLLPNKDAPILDVGCGYGKDSQTLSDMGYKLVGIDMSSQLLDKGKQMYPNLSFLKMDIRKLDFPDANFSGAWCNAVLLHLNDQDIAKALGEIHRVLVPGGVIAVSFKEGTGSKLVTDTFTTDLSRFYNFKTQASLDELLTDCGFKVKQSHILNERERFGPDKRDLNWVWSFAIKM